MVHSNVAQREGRRAENQLEARLSERIAVQVIALGDSIQVVYVPGHSVAAIAEGVLWVLRVGLARLHGSLLA